jgi:hypothetical protein
METEFLRVLQNKLDTLVQLEKEGGHNPPSDMFYRHLREFVLSQNKNVKLKKHQIEEIAKRCVNEFFQNEQSRDSIYHKIVSNILSGDEEDLTVERLNMLPAQPPSFDSMSSIDYLQSRLDYIEDYLAHFH